MAVVRIMARCSRLIPTAQALPIFIILRQYPENGGFPTNSDGINPQTTLILSDNTLYGVASAGGAFGLGTVYKLNTDGTGFTVLLTFNGYGNDGDPTCLVLAGNALYCATDQSPGTIFKLNTDGTGFTALYVFSGLHPNWGYPASLTVSSGFLYGTTPRLNDPFEYLGYHTDDSAGSVFALALSSSSPIPLSFTVTGSQLILSWSDPNFALQTALSLTGAFAAVPGATSPYTNAVAGRQTFFRLVNTNRP